MNDSKLLKLRINQENLTAHKDHYWHTEINLNQLINELLKDHFITLELKQLLQEKQT